MALKENIGNFWKAIVEKARAFGNSLARYRWMKWFFGLIASGVAALVDLLLRMNVRLKLSLIVGVALAVVVFIISTITVNRQETQLREQTEILGKNIIQGLADVTKDNLLLNTTVIIQEHISNIDKRDIPGLEVLSVVDRNRSIVAHSQSDSVGRVVSDDIWAEITGADSLRLFETPKEFRYAVPILVVIRGKDETKNIFLGGALISFSKEILLASIEEMKQTIVIVSSMVTIGAIIIVFLIAGRIVQIIVALSEAARLVGLGHLHVKVDTRIKDEIGTLAKEFNLMVRQIREKYEMEKFVSRSTVEMLSDGKEATLGGTRKVITILFSDIRNFTGVSETLWPEEVVELLNTYLDLQTRIIQGHKGVVDKFLGDGLMSIFVGEEMAYNAVSAAIDIQREVARLKREREKRKEITLAVGIGIATGRAVLGSIGAHDRMDYTVIGDTVNLASRLCRVAGEHEITVMEDVVARLNGRISVSKGEEMSVKGKRKQVSVYKVLFSTS